jgi:hypothetical protein
LINKPVLLKIFRWEADVAISLRRKLRKEDTDTSGVKAPAIRPTSEQRDSKFFKIIDG